MKKFFAAIFAAVLGASALLAGDAEDVKAVLVRQCELTAAGDFAGVAASLAPDYVEMTPLGVFNRTQIRWACEAWDGKHPEEYMLTVCKSLFRLDNPQFAGYCNAKQHKECRK